PDGTLYTPLAVDSVARDLFGDEALGPHGRAHEGLRRTIQALIQRTWLNLRKQAIRSKVRILDHEKIAIAAFEKLDREKLTKRAIRTVINKVAAWRTHAEVLQTQENLEKMEKMDEELKRLMVGLGAKLELKTEHLRKPTVDAKMLKSLASEEDVADIISLYNDFFKNRSLEDSVPIHEQQPTIDIGFAECKDGSPDPGVEVEYNMSPEALSRALGFVNGLPFLFNTHRHTGGLSSWDPADAHLFDASKVASNLEMEAITLHWHQLCGAHSMTRVNFTEKPAPGRCCGVLVADDVGLGKTFQQAVMIAVLTQLAMRRMLPAANRGPLPPVIQSKPYLAEHATLPNLPHLILIPGTLLAQWEAELKVVFKPKSFDILIYPSEKKYISQFWVPDGPFHASKHQLCHRVIIASHSALQKDFSSLYVYTKPAAGSLPWLHPSKKTVYETSAPKTLYGQRYLSITLDEAHMYRNTGAKHSSALLILERSVLRFILTATPLQTSTKDVAGMGRLIGLPHFHSDAALKEERADVSTLRRAKGNNSEDMDEAIKTCQLEIAQRLQAQFEGRILRRTIDSLDWQRKPLISIPPYEEFLVVVQLTDEEMEIITELADGIKKSVSASNGVLMIVSRSFYIHHRMSVGFARLDMDDPIPIFHSLAQWDAQKSTKIDTCARMVRHILTDDNTPDMIFEDGVEYPDIPPPNPGEKVSQETKILIYQEFPSLGPLLRNILTLYGIQHKYIDGDTTFKQRDEIVHQFKTDPSFRVLIVSSVGGTGLNLTVASVIIFLDQPWSAQDERQIRGRSYRHPQKKVVKCYHILADQTADVILNALARGKHDMLEAFL
ncbi:P-loop containing nucleoside triphosphate hydrolase protein, partial [Lyophyllum atratum]